MNAEEDRDAYHNQIYLDTGYVKPVIVKKNEPPFKNKLRGLSSHMSLMRRSKKTQNFERSSSIMSVDQVNYDIEENEVRGKIQLKLDYDKKSSNLNVKIMQCENLYDAANNKKPDVYVKLYLIPGEKDKNNKRKTSIKKGTNNPEFNETLRYILGHIELCRSRVWVTVWHSDKFGRNKFLGEVWIPLEPNIMNQGNNAPKWYDLAERVMTI